MINFSPEQIQSSIPIKLTDKQYCQITQTLCKAQDAMKGCDKPEGYCYFKPGAEIRRDYCLSQKDPESCNNAKDWAGAPVCEYVPDKKHVQECMGLGTACSYLLGPNVCNLKK